jgi:starvation-inducible DNA-binding protein
MSHRNHQRDATYERGGPQRRGRPTAQHRQVGRLYPTRNHLSDAVRTNSIAALNQCLADATAVRSQLKFARWNVKGPNVYQLRQHFDELAATLEEHVDAVAERGVALGGQALGTVRIVSHASEVPALSKRDTDGPAMVEQVAESLAALDATLYEAVVDAEECGDLDTADLLEAVSRDVSAALGSLEAYLQGQPTSTTGRRAPRRRPDHRRGNQLTDDT